MANDPYFLSDAERFGLADFTGRSEPFVLIRANAMWQSGSLGQMMVEEVPRRFSAQIMPAGEPVARLTFEKLKGEKVRVHGNCNCRSFEENCDHAVALAMELLSPANKDAKALPTLADPGDATGEGLRAQLQQRFKKPLPVQPAEISWTVMMLVNKSA